ncbi:GrpB family protein [Streptomyces sp. MAR4 CNX-425]|uniref:GrpB family protein n=1 Tax=Streptomyces sp. MAR4 CNX-425 TaxID=3406343 RepID=UPI003B4FFB1F
MPFPDEPQTAEVVAYRPAWPGEFARLAAELRAVLGPYALAVDHVGATSVPGLRAKDCVDVQVRVPAPLDEALPARLLGAAGYRLRPEPWNRTEAAGGRECRKLVFAPPAGARRCNVHVREEGGPNARFALLFRDYLRADGAARRAWGEFKSRLAEGRPDLREYGQVKAPATEVLMIAAERWAAATGWEPGKTRDSKIEHVSE